MRVRLDILGRLLRESAVQWSEDNCLRLSAALAYYTAFSLAPLLVVATAVAGFFLGEEAVRGRLDEEIRALIGPEGARFIQSAVASARRPGSGILAGLIGTVALLLGSTAVFGELQSALNHVWSARPKREGGITRIVKARAASFAMVLSVAFVLLVSLVLSTALAAVGGTLGNFLQVPPIVLSLLNLCVSLAMVTVLFAMIFRILPDVDISWRDVWIGAAATALLFTIGKTLIGLYLGRSAMASAYGAAGALAVVLTWVYYSAMILFFGAELTEVYARRYGSLRPASGSRSGRPVPIRSAKFSQ